MGYNEVPYGADASKFESGLLRASNSNFKLTDLLSKSKLVLQSAQSHRVELEKANSGGDKLDVGDNSIFSKVSELSGDFACVQAYQRNQLFAEEQSVVLH